MKNLHSLKLQEVSLVPKGANGKTFVVVKEAPTEANQVSFMKGLRKILKSFGKKPDEQGDGNMGEGLSREAQTALEATGRILAPHKDEITDAHMDAVQQHIGIPSGGSEEGGEDGAGEGDDDVKPEHMQGGKEAAEKAYKDYMTKLGYQKYPEGKLTMKSKKPMDNMDDEDDEDEEAEKARKADEMAEMARKEKMAKENILKEDGSLNLAAIPEEMRPFAEVIAKQQADSATKLKAAEDKSVKLEKELSDNKIAQRKSEIVAKAASFTNLSQPDTVMMLELADAAGKEKFDAIVKGLEANDKQIGESRLFGEIGSSSASHGGGAGGSDIMSKIEKSVADIVQKSAGSEHPISKEQAMADYLSSPDGMKLYEQEKTRRQAAHPSGA